MTEERAYAARLALEPYADMSSRSFHFHFLTEVEGLVDPAIDEAELFNSYEILEASSPAPRVRLYHTHNFNSITLHEPALRVLISRNRAAGRDSRVTEHALSTLCSITDLEGVIDMV